MIITARIFLNTQELQLLNSMLSHRHSVHSSKQVHFFSTRPVNTSNFHSFKGVSDTYRKLNHLLVALKGISHATCHIVCCFSIFSIVVQSRSISIFSSYCVSSEVPFQSDNLFCNFFDLLLLIPDNLFLTINCICSFSFSIVLYTFDEFVIVCLCACLRTTGSSMFNTMIQYAIFLMSFRR